MPSAVVYVKDLGRMQAFYERVAKLTVTEVDEEYVELHDLVLVRTPPEIAAGFVIGSPAVRRMDAAVKLVFDVPVLAAARVRATQLGGVLDPVATEWEFGAHRLVDGNDPEGNPVQLREPLPRADSVSG